MEGGREDGKEGRRSGYRTKNKNPTRQCGEQTLLNPYGGLLKWGGTPYRPKINQFFIIVLKPMVTWGSHPF